ncbi:MAG: hypothetical protein ACJ767_00555 [Chloroflexota bacterium]
MTQVPPGASMSARLGERLGPEGLASVLAAPVLLVAALVFLLAPGGSSPPGAIIPPGSTASRPPTPPTAVPPPATPTSDTSTAQVVLQFVDDLLATRSDLAATVAPRRPMVRDILDRLTSVNGKLITLEQPVADLGRDPKTADLAARIVAVSDATHAVVANTLGGSITNVAAYRRGGQRVVDAMKPLVGIRAELVAIVTPGATPSPGLPRGEPSQP